MNTLVIEMQGGRVHGGQDCCNCGKPASSRHGLPMFEGWILPLDWAGEWGGLDCCEACYEDHLHGRGVFATPGPWRPAAVVPAPSSRWRRRA